MQQLRVGRDDRRVVLAVEPVILVALEHRVVHFGRRSAIGGNPSRVVVAHYAVAQLQVRGLFQPDRDVTVLNADLRCLQARLAATRQRHLRVLLDRDVVQRRRGIDDEHAVAFI
jgi:hypothetical protein